MTTTRESCLRDERVSECVTSVIGALEATPVPYWRGKSEKQASKSVLQPILNAYIEEELLAYGWEREYRVTGHEDGGSGMRVDFSKNVGGRLVVVEVQFGNVGRFFGDLAKFLHLQSEGRLALAVHVALTDETALQTDSGIATFETTVRRIAEFRGSILKDIPVPMLALGLSHHGAHIVDFSKSQFPHPRVLQGEGAKAAITHAVTGLRSGLAIEQVGPPPVNREPLRARSTPHQAELL